ncbi:hypothetical protein CU098_011604 [Rhizopus stolonifer]|uniref:DIS3-like exonuclease 2 n=1 Tax=Rhizopus stolonifer TaxID=4846 RepID=A0A367KY95_RHIST|nr:hypothetical protein CU098_011604 [Rhizopus stolonifer]
MEEPDTRDDLNNQDVVVPSQEPKKRKTRKKKPKTKTDNKEKSPKQQGFEEEVSDKPLAEQNEPKENTSAVKKKKNRKRKNEKTAAERHVAAGSETDGTVKSQSIEVFDYKELEKELGGPEELANIPAIHFSPEKKLKNVVISKSRSATVSEEPKVKSRYKGKPTATPGKGRYSAVPPPQSLTVERKGKSKRSENQEKPVEKEEIEQTKKQTTEKQSKKSTKRDTEDEFKISAPSVRLPSKKDKKHTASEKGVFNNTPLVFVKASDQTSKAENKPTVLDESTKLKVLSNGITKSKSTDMNKNSKKEQRTIEYCHPSDIIYSHSRARFDRYLDPKVCQKKMDEKDSKVYTGVLRINKRSHNDAYVTTDKLEADIFILGLYNRNRALEGDIVFVELIELEAVWDKKKESMARKRKEQNKDEVEVDDEKLKPKYAGKVIAISESRKERMFSGTISISKQAVYATNTSNGGTVEEEDSEAANGNRDVEIEDTETDLTEQDSQSNDSAENKKNKKKGIHKVWFKPIDKRAPLIGIPVKQAPLDIFENEKKYAKLIVVVKVQKWAINSVNPTGAFVRELGHIGNIATETEAVLSDNNISESPFSNKALKGLPPTPWSIKQLEIDKRRDLRETRIFTIDPATAKDLDDAVHVTKLAENEFEVGVHIADVSHFVKQHTALDHEAFDRGTSTYLCDRVIPMLPSLLCEELCSLNPGVDRLAFSVIWKMDREGNVKDTWFGKTVIRSCTKLAYDDAQSVIEGQGLPKNVTIKDHKVSEVEQDIIYLLEMSKSMRKRRFANGALSINSIKLSFKLNELGEPCEISVYEQKDSNRLIEEFMLRANMSVAEKINEHYPNEALLRQHSPPHEKSLDEFIKIAENLGYKFDGSTAGSLQESFNAIESEDAKEVLRLLAVKPMQRAKYFCAGSCEEQKFRHYALNVPFYTHFTSPIRRFPDIIVHRQLEAALSGKKTCGYQKDSVQKAANHCNERKEGAKNSQDSNIQLYLYHYLYNLEKELGRHVICTAIVTQVLKDSFDILVPEYGIEKRIYMDSIPITKHVYDGNKNNQSVYWKENVDSSWEWDQKRRNDKSGVEIIDKHIYLKGAVDIPKELLVENALDKENRMQRFNTFSKLNVRIQVNVERSPPLVNVYPINPFM